MTARWSKSEIAHWHAHRKWMCGFNFLPSTAVNFLEMWHQDSFDAATIERELGWAADLGFNAFRFNLHDLVWQHDRDGLLARLDTVMGIADGRGIASVPVLFDDCGFGGQEPRYGPQPDPVPGVHNSRAVASPGRARLLDGRDWGRFEAYVRDIVGTFRADPRIAMWDLYNEPGNRMIFGPAGFATYEPDFSAQSHRLMRDAVAWARAASPDQPLTVAAWITAEPGSAAPSYQSGIDRDALALSDLVSFHAYLDTPSVERIIAQLAALDRPMVCTEWMARAVGSRIADQLRLFRSEDVGCFQWGLVRGRTQTWLPWPDQLVARHGGAADRREWFHDLLDRDGAPHDPAEMRVLADCLSRR